MISYHEATRRFRVKFLFDAAFAAKGNFCEAARLVGLHRNTFTRLLSDAGYPPSYMKRLIKQGNLELEPEEVPSDPRQPMPVRRAIPPSLDMMAGVAVRRRA